MRPDLPQSVKDALADAQTLRRVALDLNGSGRLRDTALWVVRASAGKGANGWRVPFASGRKAARAAFRAVPGLRGSE